MLFTIFRNDPFDVRLHTHKIEKLSARVGRTVFSVTIEKDLRAVFFLKDNVVCTFDVGSHDIFK